MHKRARCSQWLRFERDNDARASPCCAAVASLDHLRLVARKQQNLVERIVAGDFVDQRIEKGPAADIEHWLRHRLGALSKPGAEAADQDDGLPQHGASSTKPRGIRGEARRLIMVSNMLGPVQKRIDANTCIGAQKVTVPREMRSPR